MASIEETRRLTHLVKIGYRIYRGTLAIPAPPPKPPAEPIKGFSEVAYVEGLKREIEEDYSSPDGTLQYLISKVRDGSLPAFSESDCVTAVEILDELLTTALFVQSRLGDGPKAIQELESQVPGLPRFLYGDILGYYSYINH